MTSALSLLAIAIAFRLPLRMCEMAPLSEWEQSERSECWRSLVDTHVLYTSAVIDQNKDRAHSLPWRRAMRPTSSTGVWSAFMCAKKSSSFHRPAARDLPLCWTLENDNNSS
jgi:hypothetical protein